MFSDVGAWRCWPHPWRGRTRYSSPYIRFECQTVNITVIHPDRRDGLSWRVAWLECVKAVARPWSSS
jgi:hypothetical protein